MCRSIRPLFNFEPAATDADIRAASLQFVRKLSGFARPSQVNEAAFDRAVDDVSSAARQLLDALVTKSAPADRNLWGERAKARAQRRYGRRPIAESKATVAVDAPS